MFWYCLLDLEDIFFTGFHITDVDFAALRNLLKSADVFLLASPLTTCSTRR